MGYRYIGSKARVASEIGQYLGSPGLADGVFIDAFSGTGVVSSRAADLGWGVISNDIMNCAAAMSEARLLSKEDVPFSNLGGYENALFCLHQAAENGFIWREYSPASLEHVGIERKYFTEENARHIDGASKLIHQWKNNGTITRPEFILLIATLISATNNVANIAGTYGCFLSKWQQQALGSFSIPPLELRETKVDYSVTTNDVFSISSNPNDVVYFDPPYTKRQYAAYYHILETIALGDEPVVSGVAGLRPWKDKASVFCYKTRALDALVNLVISQAARRVLISYSNDGHIQLDQLAEALKASGTVQITELGLIGRYRPNLTASANKPEVREYLIEYNHSRG